MSVLDLVEIIWTRILEEKSRNGFSGFIRWLSLHWSSSGADNNMLQANPQTSFLSRHVMGAKRSNTFDQIKFIRLDRHEQIGWTGATVCRATEPNAIGFGIWANGSDCDESHSLATLLIRRHVEREWNRNWINSQDRWRLRSQCCLFTIWHTGIVRLVLLSSARWTTASATDSACAESVNSRVTLTRRVEQ